MSLQLQKGRPENVEVMKYYALLPFKDLIEAENSAYVAIPCVTPIALGGFYSFNGMNFYEYMGKKL